MPLLPVPKKVPAYRISFFCWALVLQQDITQMVSRMKKRNMPGSDQETKERLISGKCSVKGGIILHTSRGNEGIEAGRLNRHFCTPA
jgi:hypothetical protein